MTDTDTPAPARREGIAHVMMLIAVLIFAVNYVVGRWAAGDTPPYTLGFVRWTSGMLILLPFAWAHLQQDRDFIRRHWKLLCLAGFLMPFMGAGVTYVALTHTGAINGGVIQTSMPVMIVLLSWMFLRERTAGIQWLGIIVAIGGVLYIVARGNPSSLLDLTFNIGDAILISCNLGLAGYGVAVRKLPAGIHPLSLITVVCAVGALCHVPFFAYEMASGVQIVFSTKTFVSLAYVAIFPSVVAILLWNSAIGRIGPSRAGFYMYLTPVYAAIFAIPLLGESIGMYHIVGAVLIVIGVTLSSRKPKSHIYMTEKPTVVRSDGIAHVMMLVAMLIFALNYIIGRWAVGDTPPYTMGLVRWGGGALILMPLAWRHLRDDLPFIGRYWKRLCIAGFMMPFMVGGVSYVAMTHTSAINAGVIVTSTPVMTVLLSWVVFKEPIRGAVWLGISLAIAGVLYMVSRGDPASLLGLTFNIGDLLLVGSCLGVGAYGVTVKTLPAGFHPLSLLTVVCVVGAICHMPFVAYELGAGEQVVLSVKSAVSLVFLAIFPSVVAILIWNSAIARIGPSRSTFYMYTIPVFTAILAIPLLGESIGVYHVVGAVLIVIGVTLASWKSKTT